MRLENELERVTKNQKQKSAYFSARFWTDFE